MFRYLLLDLDNTLYSDDNCMDRDIVRRMNEYVVEYLGLPPHEALALRRERVRKYGTTLEWLMAEHHFHDPEDFFAKVHPEGEEYCIEPDPELSRILDSIQLPKAILTNAPREHAERVLAKLGVRDRFLEIYDIRFNGLKGKPNHEAFRRVCAACGVEPREALFVDDLPKYVRGFVDMGGAGVLLDGTGRHADAGLKRIRSLAELPDLFAAEAADAGRL